MWFERASAVLGLAREVSWGWVCPVHCGSSVFLPFAAGSAIGFLLGFLSSLALLFVVWNYHLRPCTPDIHIPSRPRADNPNLVHRVSRLARYLDEQPGVH